MDELLGFFLSIFALWGALAGLILSALLTWAISSIVWGEFHLGLFVGLAIPLIIVGIYLQHTIDKNN